MPDPEYTAAIAALKVGDKVMMDLSRYGIADGCVVSVTKITPTQIVCGEARFRKSDGLLIGANVWDRAQIVFGKRAQQIAKASTRRNIEKRLGLKLWRKSIDVLRAVADEAEAFLRSVGEWEVDGE